MTLSHKREENLEKKRGQGIEASRPSDKIETRPWEVGQGGGSRGPAEQKGPSARPKRARGAAAVGDRRPEGPRSLAGRSTPSIRERPPHRFGSHRSFGRKEGAAVTVAATSARQAPVRPSRTS